MIGLYTPAVEDLWFKAQMLGDEQTMSYNHAYGGTISFPEEKWGNWHDRWILNHENKRFYRYIKAEETFIGEVACHLDENRGIYLADVVVYAPYRGKGYGRRGLLLLCEMAKEMGVRKLYDEIAIDNPAIALFLACGFTEERRSDEVVLVKKVL